MKKIDRETFLDLQKYNHLTLAIKPELTIEQGAIKVIKNINLQLRHTFGIVCGISQNGAYGLAIARNLIALGKDVYIYIVDNVAKASPEFKYQWKMIEKLNIKVNYLETIGELEDFPSSIHNVNTIIDAITGIEFDSSFNGAAEYVIDSINKSRTYTISVDIPSGMDYDTGIVSNLGVNPDLVVTFEDLKEGLINQTGLYKYEVIVERIGLIKRGTDVRHKTY